MSKFFGNETETELKPNTWDELRSINQTFNPIFLKRKMKPLPATLNPSTEVCVDQLMSLVFLAVSDLMAEMFPETTETCLAYTFMTSFQH